MHQLCNAFVEHSVYQVRCLVPLLVFVLLYGQKHEGFLPRERESKSMVTKIKRLGLQ